MNQDHYEFNIKVPKVWVRDIVRNYAIIGVIVFLSTSLSARRIDLRLLLGIVAYGVISAGLAFLQWRYLWVLVWIGSYLAIIGVVLALIFGFLNLIF